MWNQSRRVSIVMVDDDEDDCFIIKEALAESELDHELTIFNDGPELMDYLYRRGKYADSTAQRPDLILLDLYLPGINGRELLRQIKKDPQLRKIDVVVLTTSTEWEDMSECYQLGATAVFTKGAWLDTFAEIIRISGPYWFKFITVQLSPGNYEPHSAM